MRVSLASHVPLAVMLHLLGTSQGTDSPAFSDSSACCLNNIHTDCQCLCASARRLMCGDTVAVAPGVTMSQSDVQAALLVLTCSDWEIAAAACRRTT